MNGKQAKKLRKIAKLFRTDELPTSYVEVTRTVRNRAIHHEDTPGPTIKDGIKFAWRTVTLALDPKCLRYVYQKLKVQPA